MIVMKFGGTSVKDPDAIAAPSHASSRASGTANDVPVVVVSAMSGITDQLLDAVAAVERGAARRGARTKAAIMRDRHRSAVDALLSAGDDRELVIDALERQWRETASLLHAMAVLREVSPRSRDAVVAMGELASSRLVAAALDRTRDAGAVRGRAGRARHQRGPWPGTAGPRRPRPPGCTSTSCPSSAKVSSPCSAASSARRPTA